MSAINVILDLDRTLYLLSGKVLTEIPSLRNLRGTKMVVSDFDGASPELVSIESTSKFAHAILEKQLREQGQMEIGGRVVVLKNRNRGNRSTELLYVNSSAKLEIERALEHEEEQDQGLLYSVHSMLAKAIESQRPGQPTAFVLQNSGFVDVVVADKNNVYGTCRISSFRSNAQEETLARNLDSALTGIEQENNIAIKKFHVQHLLINHQNQDRWIEALASSRRVSCKSQRKTEVLVNGLKCFSSVISQLHILKPSDSCSPPSNIANFQINQWLPWVSMGMAASLIAALLVLGSLQFQIGNLKNDIIAKRSAIDAQVAGLAVAVPEYQPYLATVSKLAYAQGVPSLRRIIGQVSEAAGQKATQISTLEIEYLEDVIRVSIKGRTDKYEGNDSMLFYNRFITALRGQGFELAESELKRDTKSIQFEMQLDHPVQRLQS